MYNWSVDINVLKKNPKQYLVWKLEQLVNFGLGNEKIKKDELEKYLPKIKIDPEKRKYLEFLLRK